MTREAAAWCSFEEYKMRVEGMQQAERQEWERARWQVFMMMRMHPYMKQKPSTPQDFVRFPWEYEQKNVIPQDIHTSEDEVSRLKEIFTQYNARHEDR